MLTFSDLQADIVAELIRAGVTVHAFNQRDIAGILAMIRTLGALVGAAVRRKRWPGATKRASARWRRRPRAAEAKGLFRGMGRSADQRHRLGL